MSNTRIRKGGLEWGSFGIWAVVLIPAVVVVLVVLVSFPFVILSDIGSFFETSFCTYHSPIVSGGYAIIVSLPMLNTTVILSGV